MSKFVGSSIALAILLGVCAFAVFLGDSETLVPSPEQTTEGFFKQLRASRYSRAIPYLDLTLKSKADSAILQSYKQQLESRLGQIQNVQAISSTTSNNSAEAVARLEGKKASAHIRVALQRQQGVWKVGDLNLNLHSVEK